MISSVPEGDFDEPPAPFPSLELQNGKSTTQKRSRVNHEQPIHFMATSGTALSQELMNNINGDGTIIRIGKNGEPLIKRPVGRPRLYPKKELDPNRIKRVAKGDKPLGRPRTAHLKPPVVKRPRGRPRKDVTAEGITPYSAATIASNSSSFASGLYSIIAASADLQPPGETCEGDGTQAKRNLF